MYKIYKYTNTINNKIYIGQTKRSLKERAGSNGISYINMRGSAFSAAILKYGWQAFVSEIIKDDIETPVEADYWEAFYIIQFKSNDREYGYNNTNGGDSNKYGLTQEARRKVGAGVRSSETFQKNNFKAHAKKIVFYNNDMSINRIFNCQKDAIAFFNSDRRSFRDKLLHFTRINGGRVLYMDKNLNNKILYKQVKSIDDFGNVVMYENIISAVIGNDYDRASFIIRSINSGSKSKYHYKADNKYWYICE